MLAIFVNKTSWWQRVILIFFFFFFFKEGGGKDFLWHVLAGFFSILPSTGGLD